MRRLATLLCLAICAGSGCRNAPEPAVSRVRVARPQRAYTPRPVQQAQRPRPISPAPAARYAGPTWFPKSGRISPRWTTIVIHHSATSTGGAAAFHKYHVQQNGWDELGYHFVIGNGTSTADGLVEVGSRWHKQKHGAHCKTPNNYYNDHGIGICLVGDFTKSRPTRKQLESLTQLVRFLSRECRIPPARIITHRDVNNKTLCPGSHFSVAWLRSQVGTAVTASAIP